MTSADRGTPSSRKLANLAASLRGQGASASQIAERLRVEHGVRARAAWRLARGWSQKDAAENWNERWPDNPKTAKNISYWEMWPSSTGYRPSIDVLTKLATLYGCHISDLLSDIVEHPEYDLPTGLAHQMASGSQDDSGSNHGGNDWFTESFRALLRLDLDTPEVISERTIISQRNDLTMIDTFVSAPRHPSDVTSDHQLNLDLLFGGELIRVEQPSESQFRYIVNLAQPLAVGDRHTVILRTQVPSGQEMASHLVQIPLSRTDRCYLRARFPRANAPERVWLLSGVAPSALYDPEPTSDYVTVDGFGEVSVEFSGLRLGWVYGIRWK